MKNNNDFVVYRPRKENFAITKKGRPSDIKVGIVMPIPYRAATSSLFFQMAYTYLNSLENVHAYRYVFDIDNKRIEALDTEMSIKKLDAILISLPFELDYVTAAYILHKLGIMHREKGLTKPLVIAGGLAPTSNPLPLAEIVDAVVIGEAEKILDKIVYSLAEHNPIKMIEDIHCVSVTPFTDIRRRCVVEDLDNSYHPIQQFYSLEEEPIYGYGVRIEVSRGCPYLCAFCMESHVLYPFRYRSITTLERIVAKGIEFLGIPRIVLYSLSLFSVPNIDIILDKLVGNGIKASIPSIRIEHVTLDRLEVIKFLGQKTITLAPESLVASHSCRIGKCYRMDHLIDAIESSYKLGFDHVKLYLITGFPDLSIDDEFTAFKDFMDRLSFIKKRKFIEISLNPLVPKPWTPYQYLPPEHVLNASKNISVYRSYKNRIAEISILDPMWAFAQAVIALGSRDTSKLIIEWALHGLGLGGFRKALRTLNQESSKYIKNGWDTPPWYNVVDMGLPMKYLELRARFLKAL